MLRLILSNIIAIVLLLAAVLPREGLASFVGSEDVRISAEQQVGFHAHDNWVFDSSEKKLTEGGGRSKAANSEQPFESEFPVSEESDNCDDASPELVKKEVNKPSLGALSLYSPIIGSFPHSKSDFFVFLYRGRVDRPPEAASLTELI